ncbi:MAG: hypothetical protein ACXWLB_13390 [Reyranella sp.]
MSALPNATSQGSNAAGGGAFSALALTAISAAKAEPDTIASAVANKAIFFMTRVPINLLRDQLDPDDPQGRAATATNS